MHPAANHVKATDNCRHAQQHDSDAFIVAAPTPLSGAALKHKQQQAPETGAVCREAMATHLPAACQRRTGKAAVRLQATNTDLANRLYNTPEIFKSSRFSKPKLSQTGFQIGHYAGAVGYKTDNFLVSHDLTTTQPSAFG